MGVLLDTYMNSLVVTSLPNTEPITLTDIKRHLNVSVDDDDPLIPVYSAAARKQFEHLTNRIVLPTEFTYHLETWCHPIRFPVCSVTAVASVGYYDEDNVQQSFTGYSTDFTGCPALLWHPDEEYPALTTARFRPITIAFTAGWLSVSVVPPDVKLAIALLTAHYFSNREAYGEVDFKETPMGFTHLCSMYDTGIGKS